MKKAVIILLLISFLAGCRERTSEKGPRAVADNAVDAEAPKASGIIRSHASPPPPAQITDLPAEPVSEAPAAFDLASAETDSTAAAPAEPVPAISAVNSSASGLLSAETDSTAANPAEPAPAISAVTSSASGLLSAETDSTAAAPAEPVPAISTRPVDTMPFDTTITGHPPNPSHSTTARFTFACEKAGATFECGLDGDNYSACSSPMSYAGLAESSHTFRVRAVDAGGNMDGEEVRYDWVVRLPPVNTTPPDFVNRRGAHLTHKNPVTVSISTTSEKGVTGYYLSESPVTPKASDPSWVSIPPAKAFSRDVPFSLSSGAGEKTVYVWFKDSEGNVSEAKGGTIYLFSSRAVSLAFLLLQVAMVLVL